MTDRICVTCGALVVGRIASALYCSERCKEWAHRRPGVRPPTPRDRLRGCIACGGSMDGRHRNALYCSQPCRARSYHPLKPVRDHGECQVCKKPVRRRLTPGPVSQFCSLGHEQWRRRNPDTVWVTRSCGNCGLDIDHLKSNAKWCAPRCGSAASNDRRRAILKGLPSEPINRYRVFERDRWRCHLCHKAIPRHLVHPHPKSASLDHIIPLSCEGTPGHVLSNVAASHLHCNLAKHVAAMNEQLMLVG